MGDYTPERGDRVRVVLEGEVGATSGAGGWFDINNSGGSHGNTVYPSSDHVVSVEKIEPPVETFKPGDVVRHKHNGSVYSIGTVGALSHRTGNWLPGYRDFFTSESYEKVTLA